jgi:hypothetical protein
MSVDWQPGDLALCIKAGGWECEESGTFSLDGPQIGKAYLVVDVDFGAAFDEPEAEDYLVFGEWPGEAWLHRRFTKINPDEPDGFDRQIIAAMTGQPEQVPA